MKMRALIPVLLLFASPAFAAVGKDVDLKAPDGTPLKATYYAAAKPGPAVVLLHMCNSQRKVWAKLAELLTARGIHAIAVDYRGYGQSGGTSFEKMSFAERNAAAQKWPDDIDKVFEFLVAQKGVDRERIGAAGGSCGVNNAIQLARRHSEVKALVLLAGGTDVAGQEFLVRAPWMPIFAVAARDDAGAVDMMQWLLGYSSGKDNELKIYEKGGHGTDLFPVHKELEPAIATWFEKYLVTSPVPASAQTTTPKPGPSAEATGSLLLPGGAARTLAQVREAKKSGKTVLLPPEGVVNQMGYQLLQQGGRVDDAIAVFELNVELHPQSANVYDSLGDGYVAAGKKDKAVEMAKKTLEVLAKDTQTPEEAKKPIRESAEGKLKPAAK